MNILAGMARPAAVIFDNDGLLLDTEEAWTRAEQALFERRGLRFTMEHKRALLGSSRQAAASKLEGMLSKPGEGEALMDELHDLVMEEALAGVSPRPGAIELIATLQSAEIPLGLASNSSMSFVERTLVGAGLLNGVFSAIVCAEHVPRPKPAPDVYVEACRRLGVQRRRSVALEDSPPGVAAAVAAGMLVIAVPYFEGQELPGSDLVAASLADETVAAALGLTLSESVKVRI